MPKALSAERAAPEDPANATARALWAADTTSEAAPRGGSGCGAGVHVRAHRKETHKRGTGGGVSSAGAGPCEAACLS